MSDKIKKFSAAIRLGATFHPQAFGSLCSRDEHFQVSRTCALGAGMEALGYLVTEFAFQEFIKDGIVNRFGLLQLDGCPMCSTKVGPTFNVIAHLNDKHGWTREAIADWLEQKGL